MFTDRVASLQAEGAYAVLARAQALEAQGRKILHLEIGQPDFPTFPNVSQAGVEAIQKGQTRYTSPAGMPALRAAIAESVSERLGLNIGPECIVVGPGAKPGLFFPTLALVNPGDEVLYPDPGFPTYAAMIRVAGGIPVPVPLREENQFSFDLRAFDERISDKTRLIVLNSPANPTGGVIPLADLSHIAEKAREHDTWIMSDEIYARLAYDGLNVPSIASLPGMLERTIIVDGFSKTYAMTGWRLGYMVDARRAGRTRGTPADPFDRMHRHFHPGRRCGGTDRPAGEGGGKCCRVPAPPGFFRCGTERHPGRQLPGPAGRVLRFPQR